MADNSLDDQQPLKMEQTEPWEDSKEPEMYGDQSV